MFESSCMKLSNIKDHAILTERHRRNFLYIVSLCIHSNIFCYGIISYWAKLSERILERIQIKRILSTRVGKYLIQLKVKTEHFVFSFQAFFTCHYYRPSIRWIKFLQPREGLASPLDLIQYFPGDQEGFFQTLSLSQNSPANTNSVGKWSIKWKSHLKEWLKLFGMI